MGTNESQLTDFLGLIASFDREQPALACAAGRVAELFAALGVLILDQGEVASHAGFEGQDPPAELIALATGSMISPARVELPGLGPCTVARVSIADDGSRTISVVRLAAPFEAEELKQLDGIGKVLAMATKTLHALDAERELRAESERQAAEHARLLGALREKQRLGERMSRIQRAIVDRDELYSIFEQIVQAACDLTDVDSACLRIRGREGERTSLVAAIGPSSEFLAARSRSDEPGLGAMAMLQGRLVAIDAATGDRESLPPEWREEGFVGGMATPIFEEGEAVGSVVTCLRDEARELDGRDRQAMLSLAEHASLALTHSHALDDASHEALHDSLTGLPNRALFLDRARNGVARARRSQVPIGVLYVDLDDFKTINDSLGHPIGDQLLIAVSDRLLSTLRPSDTIARLGGDEFAILLDELREPGDAARAAQSVLDSLERPFDIDGREVFVGACVGISAGIGDGEVLLRDADLAMYRAKEHGKNRYEAFAPEMHTAMVDRLDLEVDLKRAIPGGELELHYQPIFGLETGAIAGMEALVRWNHPTRGLVPPARFIPLAETSGMVHALGRWTLNAACHQGSLWRARYPAAPGIQINVNVSASQLARPAIVQDVARALEQAQLDPDALTLEVTETALMSDIDAAVARLRSLKDLGVRIAIDDFGVGHASLRYLKRFPLDYLKVAKDFVDEIDTPGEELAILRAIIDLSRVFGLSAIAEGIETEEQRLKLGELGCEFGQGFLLSRPAPAKVADDLILQVGLLGGAGSAPTVSAASAAPAVASQPVREELDEVQFLSRDGSTVRPAGES
jgi:diguanylate cyclase (GGDEF)-like protein